MHSPGHPPAPIRLLRRTQRKLHHHINKRERIHRIDRPPALFSRESFLLCRGKKERVSYRHGYIGGKGGGGLSRVLRSSKENALPTEQDPEVLEWHRVLGRIHQYEEVDARFGVRGYAVVCVVAVFWVGVFGGLDGVPVVGLKRAR